VPATQFATGTVTTSKFSVVLDFGGQERLITVEAKLEENRERIGYLAVRAQSKLIKIPKELYADLKSPDLGTLAVSEIDPAIYVALRYGNQSPTYGTGEFPFEDTRFRVMFELRDDRVTSRSFYHYQDGPLEHNAERAPDFAP